jgi:hypothetical protein
MLVQRMRRLGRPVQGKIAALVTHLAKRLG